MVGLSFIEPPGKSFGTSTSFLPAKQTVIGHCRAEMPNYRQSLSRSLENKVLVIVRRYVNDLAASQEQEGDVRLSVSKLYKYIVADGGVPRQKKANLERMIEKAVEVLQEEGEDDEENEIDSDFEGLNEEGLMEPKVGIFFGVYGGEEGEEVGGRVNLLILDI